MNKTDPKPSLQADWRNIAMLHYVIDREVLTPWVPPGTAVDTYQGNAYLSLVGFQLQNAQLLGTTVLFHRNFVEVNLQFYVRRPAEDEWRRGVVFIKKIVPKQPIAKASHAIYHEPYDSMPMWHRIEPGATPTERRVAYGWQRRQHWNEMKLVADGAPLEVGMGTVEEFLTDLPWSYAKQADGTTLEYHVAHPRWRLWKTTSSSLQCDAAAFFGPEFVSALQGPPAHAWLVEGSEVVLHHGQTT